MSVQQSSSLCVCVCVCVCSFIHSHTHTCLSVHAGMLVCVGPLLLMGWLRFTELSVGWLTLTCMELQLFVG